MTTHTPYAQNNPNSIQEMFNSIAKDYDFGNAVLSFQTHHYWNKQLLRYTLESLKSPTLLDLCCGTGDIAFSYLKTQKEKTYVHLLDFSKEMLLCAQEKAKKLNLDHHHLKFIQGDALQVPLPNASVDAVTIAYGIRNVQNPEGCIGEMARVLKPGGRAGILELTRPRSSLLRGVHWTYLKFLLPLLGRWVTSNKQAYDYLSQSIYQFSSPDTLKGLMQKHGFQNLAIHPLFGGIASIIVGTYDKD